MFYSLLSFRMHPLVLFQLSIHVVIAISGIILLVIKTCQEYGILNTPIKQKIITNVNVLDMLQV